MPDKNGSGPVSGSHGCKETVCINASKIYDTCKDKDCLEDLRVYFGCREQELVDEAINIKAKNAEVVWVYIDVEDMPFHEGFYSVDIKYFFCVKFDVFTCGCVKPKEVEGLCTFDKKVFLFGSEGKAKSFTSTYRPDGSDCLPKVTTNLPKATVQVVDPIALSIKVIEKGHHFEGCCANIGCFPQEITSRYEGSLVDEECEKKVFVTLGLFSIVKLERDVQLLVPSFEFCIPAKKCYGTDHDPCKVFETIHFPFDEFFPPDSEEKKEKGCGACEK